jgi:hypothetical protein
MTPVRAFAFAELPCTIILNEIHHSRQRCILHAAAWMGQPRGSPRPRSNGTARGGDVTNAFVGPAPVATKPLVTLKRPRTLVVDVAN